MNNKLEEKFLDYIDGTLSKEEMEAFEKALHSDPELRKSLESYKKIVSTERIINMQKHELNANFAVKVMDRIEAEDVGFFRRYFMGFNTRSAAKVFASLIVIFGAVHLYRIMPQSSYSPTTSVVRSRPVLAKPLEMNEASEAIAPQSAAPHTVEQKKEISKDKKSELRNDLTTAFKDELDMEDLRIEPQAIEKNRPRVNDGAIPETEALKQMPITKSAPRQAPSSAGAAADTSALGKRLDTPKEAFSDKMDEMSAKRKALPAKPQSGTTVLYNTTQTLTEPAGNSRGFDMLNSVGSLGGGYLENNTEQYAGYEENTRTEVSKDPSSTFSIDIDTASYTNARRFLTAGTLPPKDSVRIEEFLNYFDYKYPQQYDKPFSLSYEIAPSPLEKDRYLLKLGIKARDKKETSKPWNLVFLVDVSSSMMDQNKLPLVQKSLRLLTENMKESDKVSIVTYAGSAGTVLEPTTIKEKSKILSAIDMLSAGGSTNGSGGITAAYELAEKSKISDGVNRVVLATDGDFNVGITSHEDLIKLIEEKRKSGITLTTLGFGIGNLKDGTMEQLANKGNGNYFYIDSFKEARKVLETDLAGTMEVVAKDVKLQIEFNPDHVQSYRLIGYENRKLKREDFNNDAIDAGEIGTGHTVTAMYEIVFANSELAKKLNDEYRYQEKTEAKKAVAVKELSSELAFLKIRYKEPEASESKLLSFPIEKAQVQNNSDEASADFRFASAVSYFGHLLRGSQYAGSYTYKDIISLAEKAKGEDKNGYRQEFIELAKDAASIK